MINDDNQQSKLVKVELNKAKEKKDDYYDSLLIKNISSMVGAANPFISAKDVVISPPDSSIVCYCAAPMEAKKSSIGFFGFKK